MADALRRILAAALNAILLGASIEAEGPCTPPPPSLRYPVEAMEQKISGPVSVRFTINRQGEPSEMRVTGDPLLRPSVEFALMRSRFSTECRGKVVDVIFVFRIDRTLSPQAAEVLRQVSEAEYELVSPAKDVVVLSDPEVTCTGCGPAWRLSRWLHKLKFW